MGEKPVWQLWAIIVFALVVALKNSVWPCWLLYCLRHKVSISALGSFRSTNLYPTAQPQVSSHFFLTCLGSAHFTRKLLIYLFLCLFVRGSGYGYGCTEAAYSSLQMFLIYNSWHRVLASDCAELQLSCISVCYSMRKVEGTLTGQYTAIPDWESKQL